MKRIEHRTHHNFLSDVQYLIQKFAVLIVLSFAVFSCSNFQNPNNFVDLFIGTGGHGHTHPAGVESVTKTLKYAFDDWCIAQMALLLKKDDEYEYFISRSGYW